MFNPLTTVAKQHLVEWFEGDQLHPRWTVRNVIGSGSTTMEDVIDGGFKITTGTGSDNATFIDFNGKRQYSHNSSVCIAVCRDANPSTSGGFRAGFVGGIATGLESNLPANCAFINGQSIAVRVAIASKDASTYSTTAGTTTLINSVYRAYKLTNGSANLKLTVNDSLEVTKTTNRPTAKMQPWAGIGSGGGGGAKIFNIRYMECYNT
jgi:hypothetical protein